MFLASALGIEISETTTNVNGIIKNKESSLGFTKLFF